MYSGSMEFKRGQLVVSTTNTDLFALGRDNKAVDVLPRGTCCFVIEQQLCMETFLVPSGRFRTIQDLRFRSQEVDKVKAVLPDGRIGWIRASELELISDT